jgi:hypothetical protein
LLFVLVSAQRLVAQALGHTRFVVNILAGKNKPQFIVFSLSLGQGLPPRSKTARLGFLSSFDCAAGQSPEAIAARILGGNGLRRGRSPAATCWAPFKNFKFA